MFSWKSKKIIGCLITFIFFILAFLSAFQQFSSQKEFYVLKINNPFLGEIKIQFLETQNKTNQLIRSILSFIKNFTAIFQNNSVDFLRLNLLEEKQSLSVSQPFFDLIQELLRTYHDYKINQNLSDSIDKLDLFYLNKNVAHIAQFLKIQDNTTNHEVYKKKKIQFSIEPHSFLLEGLFSKQITQFLQNCGLKKGIIQTSHVILSFGYQNEENWNLNYCSKANFYYLTNNLLFLNDKKVIVFPLDFSLIVPFCVIFNNLHFQKNDLNDFIENKPSLNYNVLLKNNIHP